MRPSKARALAKAVSVLAQVAAEALKAGGVVIPGRAALIVAEGKIPISPVVIAVAVHRSLTEEIRINFNNY